MTYVVQNLPSKEVGTWEVEVVMIRWDDYLKTPSHYDTKSVI